MRKSGCRKAVLTLGRSEKTWPRLTLVVVAAEAAEVAAEAFPGVDLPPAVRYVVVNRRVASAAAVGVICGITVGTNVATCMTSVASVVKMRVTTVVIASAIAVTTGMMFAMIAAIGMMIVIEEG